MKKSVITAVFVLMATLTAVAGPVDSATARQKAEAFLKLVGADNRLELNDITASTPFTEFYVFTLGESGFVLVSGEDRGESILGYSLTNRFEVKDMPQHLLSWLEGYEEAIRQRRTEVVDVQPLSGHRQPTQWQQRGGGVAPQPSLTAVAPLMSTTWNQNPYYNSLCPEDTNASQRTVTGCVATATAQIMKFWNHPATGHGSHSYTDDNYGLQSANFGATTYAWSAMPNALNSGSSPAQVNAVATLMYHIGVADEMSYGLASTGGSGAQNYNYLGEVSESSQTSLMKYFKYRPDMVTLARDDYNNVEYVALLKSELDAGRPILYSGRDPNGGHSFVIDGYDNSDQFHVNWGWGGYCDGYYSMGSLNPSGSGTGGNNGTYNNSNVALMGIRPNANFGAGGTVTAAVSGIGGTVSGAGSYSFGDTVSLLAMAAQGYRFAGWTDHERYNPKEFIGNGGDYSFTATFEPITGDTLSYCGDGRHVTSYGMGSGGTCTWGILLPASLLTAGHNLTAVQVYVPTAGSYTMTVYTGTSSSNRTAQSSGTATFTNADADAWHTFTLGTPVVIDGTQSVWIVFENSDAGFPAAITYYGGRSEGCLWGSSLWELNSHFSFMIRGVFSGSGSGGSDPDPGCPAINSFPYTMGFEATDDLRCWSVRDDDGDGYTWGITSSDVLTAVAYSLSWHNDDGALSPDNWLFMPAMALPAGQTITMTWDDGSWDTAFFAEHYGIYVATSANAALSDYTQLWQTTLATANRTSRTLDLSAYAGQTVYLAFRHYSSEDIHVMYIDNVTVSTHRPEPPMVMVSGPASLEEGEQGIFHAIATGGATVAWTLQGATPATGTGITVSAQWNAPGTYCVVATATNADGSASDSMHVTVTPLPTFTIVAESNDETMGIVQGGGTYPRGTQITLTAVPNEGYRFVRWHDGRTDPERTLTVMANVTYTAHFAAQVGIDDVDATGITINPNPASNVATLHGVAGRQVQVIDMSGRTYVSLTAPHSSLTIDVSQWPRGAYFVRIAEAEETIVKKLIVK